MIAASCLPMDMFFNHVACPSAANLSNFVQQSAAVPAQQAFPPQFPITPTNSYRCAPVFNVNGVSTPLVFSSSNLNTLSGLGMKRKKGSNSFDSDEVSIQIKRRQYEDRMSCRLTSLDLSADNAPAESSSNSPFSITELNFDPLDYAVPMEDDTGPTIEHPEDSDDETENGGIQLSDELRRYFLNSRKGTAVEVPSSIGREVVLYHGPQAPKFDKRESSSDIDSAFPINARISEVFSGPDSASHQNFDDTMMDDDIDSNVVISFPNEESSGGSRDSSPPSSGNEGRTENTAGAAYYSDYSAEVRSSSTSSSSSDGYRPFSTRQNSLLQNSSQAPTQADDVEPMDID